MDAITLLRVEANLRGLTGRDLARRAGVHEATVSRVLNGQITSPDSVRRLQRAVHAELFDAGEPAGSPDDPGRAA